MTRVERPTPGIIREAAALLRRGGLVAFPTETVYGLGGSATSDAAVAGIFRAKGRPARNPLIVHVADLVGARVVAAFDARAERLARALWPGPLTLVLPLATGAPVSRLVTAGLPTVAVRVPAHPVARALLEATLLPLAAPSANPSGRVSPTAAEHVAADLGEAVELVLDGGPCRIGLESTVIDLSGPEPMLLRPGGIERATLERLTGPLATGAAGGDVLRAPGQLASHYAPSLPLRLDADSVSTDEALLAFGPSAPAGAFAVRNLSLAGDVAEAARNLFAMLRELDQSGAQRIAVMPLPARGLGEAIRDRLARAAAPRPPSA